MMIITRVKIVGEHMQRHLGMRKRTTETALAGWGAFKHIKMEK